MEIEGIPVPATLLLEIKQLQSSLTPNNMLNVMEENPITRDMTLEEVTEAYKKLME